jgi:AbrB family looped-hinge helix DNA binding protein
MDSIQGKVSKAGRVSLPDEFRKAVGLDQGGEVVLELTGSEIRIRPIDEVVNRAQALTQQLLGSKTCASVDGFLAERRKEASRE